MVSVILNGGLKASRRVMLVPAALIMLTDDGGHAVLVVEITLQILAVLFQLAGNQPHLRNTLYPALFLKVFKNVIGDLAGNEGVCRLDGELIIHRR